MFSKNFKIFYFLSIFFLTACGHTISVRTNTMLSPTVKADPWKFRAAAGYSPNTDIELISDITSNPPGRSRVLINEGGDLGKEIADSLGITGLVVDLGITLGWGFEISQLGSISSLKWQFLGHDQKETFVGALRAGLGSSSQESSQNTDIAKTDVDSVEKGMSIGCQFSNATLYSSYVITEYSASTTVNNSSGAFGPYSDSGEHKAFSIGVSAPAQSGFHWLIEASWIDILWDRSDETSQRAIGGVFGYQW